MLIDILSLFPEYFSGPFDVSIIKRAREKGLVTINLIDVRAFAVGRQKRVDDRPFGGGPGMVLMPEPLTQAIRSVKKKGTHTIYLSPQGKTLTSQRAQELAGYEHLVLVCGHYEGIDQRVIDTEVCEEISIGDYVLTNGCLAAIVLVDALIRWIPGVLGHAEAPYADSFAEGIFDAPHYTKPVVFEGKEVPEVLRGGNHAEIAAWRRKEALRKTNRVRPDILMENENERKGIDNPA